MNEEIPHVGRWIVRGFQHYWRMTRGFHLSIDACVLDEAGRTLMVRPKNGGSWELPRDRVRKNEDVETTLRRVLRDVAGIEVNGAPELLFMSREGRKEQSATYLVRQWRVLPGVASAETGFFPARSLPATASPRATERISRSLEHRTTSEV